MTSSSRIISIVSVLSALLCSCQQAVTPRGSSVGVRNYSDAVVHINQVDPAYRAYFRAQDASNYSLSDQRKAYIAATQTARTPVLASDYRPGDIRRTAVASRKGLGAKGKISVAAARRGKATVGKAKVSVAANRGKATKGKTAAKKNAVAVRKPYRRN